MCNSSYCIHEYNSDIVDQYNDMLNDCYGDVQVCSYTYQSAHLLSEVDPIAYKIGLDEYIDSLISDGEKIDELGNQLNDEEE